ncbi:MAG: YraN family protein, partial [Anaerolineae bacterium]|nr:YraN family protein [Anaerolineae bacterium]
IDIVARQADTLVFIEVRTRRAGVEAAFESITPRKQTKLRALAYAYLSAHGLENASWRIDLIAVALPRSGPPLIEHLEDGLSW